MARSDHALARLHHAQITVCVRILRTVCMRRVRASTLRRDTVALLIPGTSGGGSIRGRTPAVLTVCVSYPATRCNTQMKISAARDQCAR